MVSQGIIQDFIAEKLERQKQDEFYKEYFKQRVKGQDTTQCIKDAQLAQQMYHLSENVRDLTISFQEDASFFDSSMSALIRSLDQTMKTLQTQPIQELSSSLDYGVAKPQHHFMVSKAGAGTSRNLGSAHPPAGGSSSFTKKTMISTIEGRDSNNENPQPPMPEDCSLLEKLEKTIQQKKLQQQRNASSARGVSKKSHTSLQSIIQKPSFK